VFIPGAPRELPVALITPHAVDPAPPTETELPVPPTFATRTDRRAGPAGFSWPVDGRISSGFGRRSRGHHDGIDIVAPKGSPVYAARDGTVIFADQLSGYGNVLIVEHAGGFTTVYAHNRSNLVRKGSRVRRGQPIASVGDTGRASGYHLHFEVRKQNVARNPLFYLPGGVATATAAAR
jgi:murein DD-endopeptidase MepM/ murein hydrolase activator NlpD